MLLVAPLRRGLEPQLENLRSEVKRTPYEAYRELNFGPGGYAIAPSTETRQGVTVALGKKFGR